MFNNSGYQAQGGQFNGAGQQPLGYQQTGYGQLPPQQTGYQTGYQQPPVTSFQSQLNQPTGFGAQQPLYGQQTGYIQSQPTGFVQPQQTGYAGVSNQYGTQQQQPLAPQKTGFSSAAQNVEKNETLKIPNIRLSFLTAHDQQKFEDLFRSAVPKNSNAITADAARDVLMRSGLQPAQLARIWELSDLNKSGQLLFPEFALALHLCNVALRGLPIPYQLEPNVKNEVEGFVDAISFSIPDDDAYQRKTPFDNLTQPAQQQSTISQLSGLQVQPQQTGFQQPLLSQATGYQPIQPQATGYQPLQPQRTGFQAVQPQTTGYQALQPQSTGFQQQPLQNQATGFQTSFNPPAMLQQQKTGANGMFSNGLLQQQKTGVGNNNLFQSSYLQPQRTGFSGFAQYQNLPPKQNQEFIKPQEKELFSKIFDTYDSKKNGHLDPQLSAEIFRKSGLNRSELEKVWNLITTESTTHLNKESFSLGMWLIYRKLNGNELPNRLPDSLLPDSLKNVNYVKNKLKSTPSFAKPSGSVGGVTSFNTNDMNSSKNRRKTDSPVESKSQVDDLKRQVQEKQRHLDSLNANTSKQEESNSKELQQIEDLKNQIRTLPKPNLSNDTLQQKDKLNTLVSRVPNLISEISRIDNDITNSRIDLYKIQHPSSIVGSGPNGEVTESDKRKAKSKVLLAQRMAALTGKTVSDPTADFENEQNLLNEEVAKIKSKNKETQEIIYDIEKSIKDISQGVLNSLSKDNDPANYRKFELGLGVEPDVAELIKSLRISDTSSVKQSFNHAPANNVAPQSSTSAPQSAATSKPSTPDSYSSYKTPEDRAAFIKEQAKRKMNERLAKFGISRHKNESGSSVASPQVSTPPPAQEEAPKAAPQQPTQSPKPSIQSQAQAKSAPPPPPTSRVAPKPTAKQESAVDEEVDEEELKLRQQLEDLKKKKEADKQARLAKLRRELEEAENEDDEQAPQQQVKTFAPQPKTASPNVTNNVPQPEAPKAPVAETNAAPQNEVLKHHDTNPFAKSQGPTAISSNNPFGKPQQAQKIASSLPLSSTQPKPVSQTPSYDSKTAEAQRKAQRGFGDDDDDDGWGTEDDKSDDDDELPNRQGAAHLAGLLFSGMGPPRASTNSQPSTPKPEQSKSLDTAKPKPTPVAPPIPSISSSTNQVPQVPQPSIEVPSTEVPSTEVPSAIPPAPPLETPIPPAPPTPPYPTEEGPADDAFAAHPHPELQREESLSDDEQFVDSLSTPANASPAPQAPPLPQADVPQLPDSIPPPLPQASAPAPTPLPESSAPAPPPLPQASAPDVPSFSDSRAPEVPPLPESNAPAAPPLPESSAPAAPPLPESSAPAPPPLPQSSAPPAPPSLPSFGAPAAPPPPPPAASSSGSQGSSLPPAPAAGGLPFLADIQKFRDDSHVVG